LNGEAGAATSAHFLVGKRAGGFNIPPENRSPAGADARGPINFGFRVQRSRTWLEELKLVLGAQSSRRGIR
jgi:hypothetical protein